MSRSLIDAALAYTERGIPVLPLHGVKDGRCTCGKDCGRNAGKHPHQTLVPNGLKDASIDPDQVGRWFRAYPDSNVGIVLRDLVAIDEDEPGAILAAGLELPNGPVSRTGRGHHHLFKLNGRALLNGRFAPGLDCKTGEAYIVAPPSMHASGKLYSWVAGHGLDVDLTTLPEAVEQLIVAAHAANGSSATNDTHNLRGLLEYEKVFDRLAEAEKAGDGDRWRKLVLQLIFSLIARGARDDLIVSFCRRTTWTSHGWTHKQTDEFVIAEIRRARVKTDHAEPDEDDEFGGFTKVDGEQPQPSGAKGVEVKPRRTDWLWHPYFPAGELSLLGAKGGVGKGNACASVVARLTTGILWPDGSEEAPAGHVLWAEAEDSIEKTVVPRLIANRVNLSHVTFFNEEEFSVLDLGRFVAKRDPRAIILSPIMAFMPRLKSHIDELAVRAELKKLKAAVDGTLCALIGIAHLNKKSDLDAVERLLGSVAFANFVRSVVLLACDKDQKDVRRWVHAKHNLSVRGGDLLFRTVHVGEDPRDQYVKVEWEIPNGEDIDVDSFFDRRKEGGDHKQSATEWLISYLQDHGRCLAKDVMTAGVKAGHTAEALRKAQHRDKRIAWEREGFPGEVWWSLK